jgi:hypothetical protein
MAAFAAGTKVLKKASPMPTEDGYDPPKAGENVALNANCRDAYAIFMSKGRGLARV